MTFNEIMNSPLLYGLVGLGIAYIILFCLITLKKAYKMCIRDRISSHTNATSEKYIFLYAYDNISICYTEQIRYTT